MTAGGNRIRQFNLVEVLPMRPSDDDLLEALIAAFGDDCTLSKREIDDLVRSFRFCARRDGMIERLARARVA